MDGILIMSNKEKFAPFIRRDSHKLTTIYSLSFSLDYNKFNLSLTDVHGLNFGRLSRFYESNKDQFPRLIGNQVTKEPNIELKRTERQSINYLESYCFVLPSGQVIFVVSIGFSGTIDSAISVMEDFYYRDVKICGDTLEQNVATICNLKNKEEAIFEAGYHQIFNFSKDHITEDIDKNLVQKIIYRANLPYREEFNSIKFPLELNRRPNTFCALGPFVTAMGGHQGYMEDCILVSAIGIIGCVDMLAKAKRQTYDTLKDAQLDIQNTENITTKRKNLANWTAKLRKIQTLISLFVDTPSDIGMVVPALRLESYHQALAKANEISVRSDIVSTSVAKVESLIQYEFHQLNLLEKQQDEAHRTMWTVVVSLLSAIAIPPSIILSYFGMNTKDVDTKKSITDFETYSTLYYLVGGGIFFAFFVGLIVWLFLRPSKIA